MSNDRIYEIAKDWAYHIEVEIRLHTGMPKDGRQEANAIAHNAILGALVEMLDEVISLAEAEEKSMRGFFCDEGPDALANFANTIRSLKTIGRSP